MLKSGILAKGVFIAAVIAGSSYLFVSNSDEMTLGLVTWKALGVWLLAIFAFLAIRPPEGSTLAAIMAFCALGDVLVERDLRWGAIAFGFAHILAIAFYLGQRRKEVSASQQRLGTVLPIAVPIITWFLTKDIGATVYAILLGFMASMAWTSRFPRYWTGLGAVLFVLSDLLIFAEEGVFGPSPLITYLIWAFYFGGQAMIVYGIVTTMAADEDGALQA